MITLRKKIFLASNSPRRKELLTQLGILFETRPTDVEETFEGVAAEEVSAYLATKKAKSFEADTHDELILCADTVVVCNGAVLGKPADRIEAIAMLSALSGTSHSVFTSVCLRDGEAYFLETDVAEVKFRALTQHEIEYYVDSFQPYDKAGSYGIQEWIGMVGVEAINGSFYTIMGLPTHRVYRLLEPYFVE